MRITHWLWLCAALQIFGWIFLTLLSRGVWSEGFAYEVDNNNMPTWTFIVTQGVLGILILTTWWVFRSREIILASRKGVLIVIAVTSIILRAIALFGEPIHESDFYRYIWDGKVAASGINPYRFEPAVLELRDRGIVSEYEDQYTGVTWRGRTFSEWETKQLDQLDLLRSDNPTLFNRVSHKAVTTIYPPVAQAVFFTSYKLFGDSAIGIKLLFVIFDLGVVALITAGLIRLNRSPVYAILYAWNPLTIKEFANSGHYDSVAIFFMVAALFLAGSRRMSPLAKGCSVAFLLALGTWSKYFAILLLPILLVAIFDPKNQSVLKRFKTVFSNPSVYLSTLVFGGSIAAIMLPYLIWNDAGFTEFFRGLTTYQNHWKYSPGGFALIENLLLEIHGVQKLELAKMLAAILLCVVIALIALASRKPASWRCFAAMAALFFLSPTAFPWYFCWTLVFIPFQSRSSWLILAIFLPINYIDFQTLGNSPLANVTWQNWYATQVISWGVFALWWLTESSVQLFRRPSDDRSAS